MFYTKAGTVWISTLNFESLSAQLQKTLLKECFVETDTSRTWSHFSVIGSRLIKNAVLGPDPRQNTMSFDAA